MKKRPTLAYHIEGVTTGKDPDSGEDIQVSKIVWDGEVEISADDAMAATSAPKKDHSGAVMFLMDMLSNGPAPKTLVDERAAARGFSDDQLRRAKTKMGVGTFKEKGKIDGQWFWCLPQHQSPQTEEN